MTICINVRETGEDTKQGINSGMRKIKVKEEGWGMCYFLIILLRLKLVFLMIGFSLIFRMKLVSVFTSSVENSITIVVIITLIMLPPPPPPPPPS